MPHEPKKRHSKAVKRTRRAAISLAKVMLHVCKNCNSKTLSHMACGSCGFYAGKPTRSSTQKVVVTKA